MSYVKTDWVEAVTPLNEINLDKIEQGIYDAHLTADAALAGLPPPIAGQEGKWLTVSGGAMVWAPAPAGGGGGGGGLDWEGAWAAGTAYVKGDVVTKDGVVYGAVNDSTGQTPPPASFIPTSTPIPLVTSLPVAGVFDGMEVVLVDSLTAPTYSWRFRYVAAKATNKWIFVGGAPGFHQVDANQATTSATYANLGTVGPLFAIPVAGEYIVEFGFMENSSTSGNNLYMSYDIGATPATDLDSIVLRTTGGNAGDVGRGNSKAQKRILAAVTLTCKYRVFSGDGQFMNRWMRIEPVAVGG